MTSLLQSAWEIWRSNRPLRVSVLSWLTAWIALELLFIGGVHWSYQGNFYWALQPGTHFYTPECEVAAGHVPLCKTGYDGQQYYHMANDLFTRHDAYKSLDSVMYRYQRIGIPLLAGTLSNLLGFKVVPCLLYFTVQFGITTAGFGLLMYWLMSRSLPGAYALTWLFSAGTLESLWLGLLDGPADAFFVCALAAAISRRLWLYVPAATLLLLTREMYAFFAFAVFALAVLPRVAWKDSVGSWRSIQTIDWRDVRGYWPRVALTAVPGAVMLGWAIFLAIRFGESGIGTRLASTHQHNLPFNMMIRYVKHFFRNGNGFEMRMAIVTGFTLITTLVMLFRGLRRLPLAILCTIPYVAILSMTGSGIWEDHGSHMRVIDTALVIVGLFMLPFENSLVLKFLLILHGIIGPAIHTDLRLVGQSNHAPQFVMENEHLFKPNPPEAPDNAPLSDASSSVVWTDPQPVIKFAYQGVWKRVHRESKLVTIAVTNHSSSTWHPGLGKHPIWIGYRLYDDSKSREFAKHSIILDQTIEPGETKEFAIELELPRLNRKFLVDFSVRQDGLGWFSDVDPKFGGQYVFEVQ